MPSAAELSVVHSLSASGDTICTGRPTPASPGRGGEGGGEAASSPGLPDGLPGVREAARTGAWEMSASKTLPMVSSETWAKDRSSSASLVTFPITSFTFTAGKQ